MEVLDIAGLQGTLERYPAFASRYVESRVVDVWLPPGYDPTAAQRYPVLYMHDGKNLFDPQSSTLGVDWGIDEAMTQLIQEGKIEPALVVGIWSEQNRWRNYMPQAPLQTARGQQLVAELPALQGEPPHSDAYLRFLVEELKPFMDAHYRTQPQPEHTTIMGSSMGGLISLYALCEYPQVFGGAGCVSTHWVAGEGIMIDYLRTALPSPNTHRIYFDYGTVGLDAQYEPFQQRADTVMQAAGYERDKNWLTLKFEGDDHNEMAWRRRVHLALIFLLGNERV